MVHNIAVLVQNLMNTKRATSVYNTIYLSILWQRSHHELLSVIVYQLIALLTCFARSILQMTHAQVTAVQLNNNLTLRPNRI